MLFEGENYAPIINPSERVLRSRIDGLRSAGKHSYASVSDDAGNYVQVAGGRATCMIERFDSRSGRRLRAFHDHPSPIFPDGTQLAFGAGILTLMADEWFLSDMAAEVMLCFLRSEPYPDCVRWRDAPGFAP